MRRTAGLQATSQGMPSTRHRTRLSVTVVVAGEDAFDAAWDWENTAPIVRIEEAALANGDVLTSSDM